MFSSRVIFCCDCFRLSLHLPSVEEWIAKVFFKVLNRLEVLVFKVNNGFEQSLVRHLLNFINHFFVILVQVVMLVPKLFVFFQILFVILHLRLQGAIGATIPSDLLLLNGLGVKGNILLVRCYCLREICLVSIICHLSV